MSGYIHPYFLIACPLPSLRFQVPETTQENQETISPSLSNLHIRLYCNTNHHVLNVTDPNNPLQVSHYTDANIPSRVHLQNNSSVHRSLIIVLSNWKIPEIYHEYIIRSTFIQLDTIAQDYHDTSSLPTPFLLRVDVSCHKFYCTDMMRWQESRIGGTYQNDGMIPASESSIKSLVVRKKMMKRGEIDEEEEGSGCAICLEEFLEGSVTGCMPCSHMFHEECITNWLRKSHYCPLCRFEMPTTVFD